MLGDCNHALGSSSAARVCTVDGIWFSQWGPSYSFPSVAQYYARAMSATEASQRDLLRIMVGVSGDPLHPHGQRGITTKGDPNHWIRSVCAFLVFQEPICGEVLNRVLTIYMYWLSGMIPVYW